MDTIERRVFLKGAAMGALAFTVSGGVEVLLNAARRARGAEQMAANWSTVAS